MAAFTVELDPSGYSRVEEEGIGLKWTGAELWQKATRGQDATSISNTGVNSLWNPPGSEWLMIRPEQLCQEFLDPAVPGHELATYRLNEYTFAGGVNPTEFEMDRKPGGLANANSDYWLTARTPNSLTGLDSCNYTTMFSRLGVAKPSGIKTVAILASTPTRFVSGQPLVDGDYTPCFRWLGQPWPDTTLVFGFAVFACVITNETLYVLKTSDGKQTWELLGQVKAGDGPSPMRPHSERRGAQASMMAGPAINNNPNHITVVPVGPDTLYFYFGSAEPLRIKVREVTSGLDAERMFDGGTWWLGVAPGCKLTWQTQCVSYYYAEGTGVDLGYPTDTSGELLFDLGENYNPTTDYATALYYRMQWYQGLGTVASGTAPSPRVITAAGGQVITRQLVDEVDAGFVPDGTHHSGRLTLNLQAGNAAGTIGTGACFLAPQVRGYELRFPRKITPRTNSLKTLTDLQVSEWRAEASLHDVDAKQLEIVLAPEAGSLLFGAGNWDSRSDYPVHILDGATVVARGWVDSPALEELYTEDPDSATRTTALRQYKITARGLLSRADCGWVYLPQIVNPDGEGYIEHTWIVAEVLKGCGFDTTDTAVYLAATDPLAGTGAVQVPGTWGATTGTNGEKDEGAFNPDYSQTKLRYLTDLTRDFRGWLLYETIGGLIRYHPDPAIHWGTGGRRYYVAATIYRTQAEATAASRTGQYMLAQPTRTMVRPVSNHIRLSGQGDDAEAFPHVIDSAPETLTDINDTDFLGEWKPTAYPMKLAVDKTKALQLARVALLLSKHRGRLWSVSVPLPPWLIGASGLNLGDVVTLQGSTRSDCWVHHIELFCRNRNDYITRLTVERLTAGNTSTAVGSCTGGTPFPGACLVS